MSKRKINSQKSDNNLFDKNGEFVRLHEQKICPEIYNETLKNIENRKNNEME